MVILSFCTYYYNITQHYLSNINNKYWYYGILYYRSKKLNDVFNKYCIGSTIILDFILPSHFLLIIPLEGNIFEAKHFQKEIRFYNNTLTFILCYYTINKWLRN